MEFLSQLTLRKPGPTPGRLAWLQMKTSSDSASYITRSPHYRHSHRFQELSTVHGFHIAYQMSPNSSCVSPMLSFSILSVSAAPCYWYKLFYFPLPERKIRVSTLESSSLPNLSGSLDCILIIIYLISNVYL